MTSQSDKDCHKSTLGRDSPPTPRGEGCKGKDEQRPVVLGKEHFVGPPDKPWGIPHLDLQPRGTARRSPARIPGGAGAGQAQTRRAPPGPPGPAESRAAPASHPGKTEASSQSPPLRPFPAPLSQQDPAARRAESGLSRARRGDSEPSSAGSRT
jgi:hypothetical protein